MKNALPSSASPSFARRATRVRHVTLLHSRTRRRLEYTPLQIANIDSKGTRRMSEANPVPEYRESRIEEEPILGRVLTLPDGRIQPLTWFERVLASLHLISAKTLEARYFKPQGS